MRLSKLLAERTKETPSDAQMPSHILLLKAGYIKQVANGIFSLTNLGQKACFNIENIIRDEMNKIDGQEVKFPVVMPKELWDLSGRYASIGSEMVRFPDRNGRPLLLGMTHEEAAVHLAKNWVRSYNQLPFMIYQIQTKFRDEPRSRGGLIRVREFTMKDAYSFHMTLDDMKNYYDKVFNSYERIFKRIGLKDFIPVKGDSGMMGGDESHEFIFLTKHGEDELVLCSECDYKANQEVAESICETPVKQIFKQLKEVSTNDAKNIKDVCDFLKIDAKMTIKAVVFAIKNEKGSIVCFLRGDKEINEAKLKKICKKEIFPFDSSNDKTFFAGNIGPLNLNVKDCKIFFDQSIKNSANMVVGANKTGKHFLNFCIERDFKEAEFVDISKVQEGQICPFCKKPALKIKNGIEIGNIFKLGTKYTKSMQMYVKNNKGEEINPFMGCYGIGIGRNLACVIEQNCDKNGICLPVSVAPYKVHICPLRIDDKQIKDISFMLYNQFLENNVEAIIDDREVSPGIKFADADLMGMPFRIVVSQRTLNENKVELKNRKTNETFLIEKEKVLSEILKMIKNEL